MIINKPIKAKRKTIKAVEKFIVMYENNIKHYANSPDPYDRKQMVAMLKDDVRDFEYILKAIRENKIKAVILKLQKMDSLPRDNMAWELEEASPTFFKLFNLQ